LTGDGYEELDTVQARFSDGDADRWAARAGELQGGPTTRIGVAAHSVRAVPEDALTVVAQVAGDGPRHVHLSEQPAENAATAAYHGCSPTELLARTGFLGPTATAVHATHLSDADIGLLGGRAQAAGGAVTTERDLADGIGPARALADAGSPLALGSDSQAVVDPFEELRGLEMHERLRTTCRGRFTPMELLAAASRAGYQSLGWPGGGRIAAEAPADFVVVRSESVRTAGAKPGQLALAATAADVDRVVVAGRTVVSGGEHRLGPVGPLLTRALEGVA
jgi:cytosine/adenosine deaminase-related metal-dependent hydrolase